ncbi:phage protease [Vibrio quintilis]|uniref:Mu-like prophage I protein n=1 Tax=Vibrio quintilis TaxID=1117707 RepID=A0A1M7Z1U9_9VIBR|nr:phage protease [Vibrio quintilis]SHO58792.1 Mu-like prophage I protein [Vibrio quintilis]
MKKTPLAILTSQPQNNLAVLTADLSVSDNGWYQLLPAGKFKARDGRPDDTIDGYWHLDAASAQAFISATKATAPKVLIDYDHQTLNTRKTGKKALAAAWLSTETDIEWRDGQGLYIRPDWTSAARRHIDEKEYAFFSAVFPYDKNGTPLYLRMAAITNDPGLVEIDPIAALAADISVNLSKSGTDIHLYGQTEDSVLNELLIKMLAQLGITVTGEPTREQATAALTALDALKTKADQSTELETQVATLSAQQHADVDLSKFVSVEAYNGVVTELAVLKAGSDKTSITSVIKAARESGKVVEAEVQYLTDFGNQQGVAALSAMLEKRPAIAALTAPQTQNKKPPDEKKKPGTLSDAELAVLSATGLTKEQYLASKQETRQ